MSTPNPYPTYQLTYVSSWTVCANVASPNRTPSWSRTLPLQKSGSGAGGVCGTIHEKEASTQSKTSGKNDRRHTTAHSDKQNNSRFGNNQG